MLPLYEMLMKAQNGNAMGEMSKQYGLAQEQMMKAMAAMMPAFSAGLKRTASNPYDFSALMASAASGNYTQYFEDLNKAFTPKGMADGQDALKKIFGSEEVARAMAQQAEKMSGLGQDLYMQMMPVVANAMMGGLLKQIAGQFKAAGEAFAAGRPADYFGQWMTAGAPKQPVYENPFAQSFQAFFGQPGKAPSMTDWASQNPFLQMFEAMTKTQAEPPKPAEPERPQATPESGDANVFSRLMNDMFDSGIEVQKTYQKNMEAIMDSYLGKGGQTS